MSLLGVVPGFIAGIAIWWVFIRPKALDNHERRRRALGLPRQRTLPEDR